MILAENFGKNLRAAREDSGLSLEALAKRIGNTKDSIYRWENRRSEPRLISIDEAAQALDIDSISLLGAPGSPPVKGYTYKTLAGNFLINFSALTKGQSIRALARLIKTSKSCIENWRNGITPNLRSIKKIADAFGIDPLKLLLPPA